CCGMAGGFGFEREHYEISRKCGERALLPRVRTAPKDALVIADGFSCREQIRQGSDRQALHFAQVAQLGLRKVELGDYPERQFISSEAVLARGRRRERGRPERRHPEIPEQLPSSAQIPSGTPRIDSIWQEQPPDRKADRGPLGESEA